MKSKDFITQEVFLCALQIGKILSGNRVNYDY